MDLRYPAAGPFWLREFGASILRLFKGLMDAPFRLWPVATADLPAAADFTGGLAYNQTSLRITWSNGASWLDLQPYDATLAALAALDATAGILVQTGADTFARRTLAAPAAGITIANPAGIAGNPALALANDLAALEALSGTNTLYYRSGADSWSAVAIGNLLSFAGGTLNIGSTTGTGSTLVLSGSPAITGALTYGGVTLSNAVTGTGNMVLSASPTLTGTLAAASITASGMIRGTSGGRFEGAVTGAGSGAGVEISSNNITVFNRSSSAYTAVNIDALDINLRPQGGNIGLGAANSPGGGARIVFIANATTLPTSNPSGGGILYVDAGALKWRGSSGTVTTIANA